VKIEKPVSLPLDLRWLVEGRLLTPFGVCALMKRARERGHLLSDVVKHARKQLQSPKVSNAFAYLLALLHRPVDYSFLAARMNADEEAAARKQDEREKEKHQMERVRALAGQSFAGANGDIWTIEEHGVLRIDAAGQRSSSLFNQVRAVVSAILEQRMPTFRPGADRNVSLRDGVLTQPPSTHTLAREVLGSLRQGLKRVRGR